MEVSDITKLSDEGSAEAIDKIAKAIGNVFDNVDVSIGHKFDDELSCDRRIEDGFHARTIFIRISKSTHASQGKIEIDEDGKIVIGFGFIHSSVINHRAIYEEIYKIFPDRLTCIECNGHTTCDYGMNSEPPHNVGEQETCNTCKGSGMFAPYKTYSVAVTINVYEKGAEVGGECVTYSDVEENCLDDAIADAKRRLAR